MWAQGLGIGLEVQVLSGEDLGQAQTTEATRTERLSYNRGSESKDKITKSVGKTRATTVPTMVSQQ